MMPNDAKNQADLISHCFKFSVTTNSLLPVPKVSHSHCPLSPLTTPKFMFFPTLSRYHFLFHQNLNLKKLLFEAFLDFLSVELTILFFFWTGQKLYQVLELFVVTYKMI